MDDVVAAAVAGGLVSMLATALWIDTKHALAWRDIRAMRSELRLLRHEVARHVPLEHDDGSSMQIRMDPNAPPVSPKWFEPDFPTLLRFRARTSAAVAPVPVASAEPAG